ncbi:ABC transporter permease [Paraoerskovia marina]|uniref:ABC transporter permease n=1 Tax=Paraoerskovia marina TaxID=545619 RepID=UPI000492D3F3|nr:ABC transporter permease [Paraoerskovia marina]
MSDRTWPAIRLVASREIQRLLHSKAYIVTTVLLVAAVVLGPVALSLVGGDDEGQQVGFTPAASSLTAGVESASAAGGTDMTTSAVEDRAAGEQAVTDGDLDALVDVTGAGTEIVVDSSVDPALEATVAAVSQQQTLTAAIEELGGDPAAVTGSVAESAPTVTALDAEDEFDPAGFISALATGILIFVAIMTSGQLIAQGVVEEKQSRVVEILLSTLRPWQLMVGKVAGIGLVALVQVVLVVGAGAGTAVALDLVDPDVVDLGATAAWAVVWFLIGFVTYAFALGGAASLVSRQEDVGAVLAPFTALMMVPYIVGVSIAPYAPDSPVVTWLSLVPFCSPLLMPVRMAVGGVAGWEVAVSVGLALATIPVVIWLASRIYAGAVLSSGARIKVKDALRAA